MVFVSSHPAVAATSGTRCAVSWPRVGVQSLPPEALGTSQSPALVGAAIERHCLLKTGQSHLTNNCNDGIRKWEKQTSCSIFGMWSSHAAAQAAVISIDGKWHNKITVNNIAGLQYGSPVHVTYCRCAVIELYNIHLHFGSGGEYRWSPCFSLRYECKTEPNCMEGKNRRHALGKKQTPAVNEKYIVGISWTSKASLFQQCCGTDRVFVVSSGMVRASRLPRLLKYSALPSLMVPQPSPMCPPFRLCHSGLSFPSKSSTSSVGLGADGTQLDRSTSTDHRKYRHNCTFMNMKTIYNITYNHILTLWAGG